MISPARLALSVVFVLFVVSAFADSGSDYDPLLKSKTFKLETHNLTVKDSKRKREIPVRVYLPAENAIISPNPVILFSHGLGGSRMNSPYLGEHWAARGYACVFMQHAGSDESVWKDARPLQRLPAMRKAANAENTILRFKDVPAVINQLEKWNKDGDSPLNGRLDLARLGMTGHSFGAVTTQGVSGQRTPLGAATFTDKRIKAALPMSPSSPRVGDAKQAFAGVNIPWLLMTGTNDTSIINDTTVASRRAVYEALPAGEKYELVLDGAEHSAFSDRPLPGDREKRNPNHHRVILALSTAFWDAFLREDSSARAWIDGEGPSTILEKNDVWQKK